MARDRLGWILIHSGKRYPAEGYETPREQLREYRRGALWRWHWTLSRRIGEGGPFTLLFAWHGEVFGEGIGDVTHEVEDKNYNFAFLLNDYHETKPVALADLQVRPCGGLVKLEPKILKAYRRLAKGQKKKGTR